jgi:hypothetical protein
MDLIINHETDDDILDDDSKILADVGIGAQSLSCSFGTRSSSRSSPAENETEVSFFNRALYDEYKKNPQQAW